ncbi:hypothetical protein AB0H71_16485 [Nocardia sp. NPDC050697]|uniref:hypothetical protein n=1 Tax=Nocardia sp. NPDC050697 TaxID=3155158 RepID=UPI0033C5A45D
MQFGAGVVEPGLGALSFLAQFQEPHADLGLRHGVVGGELDESALLLLDLAQTLLEAVVHLLGG